MVEQVTAQQLSDAVAALEGRSCWSVMYGPATGRVIEIQFTERIRRSTPIDNDALTPDERSFDSEYMLYVSCAWRIDGASPLSSGDLARDAGGRGGDLEDLVGRRVEAVTLIPSTLDLHLRFSGDVRVYIFCDGAAGYDNFSLFAPDLIYTAKAYDQVEVEPREYE